MKKKWVISLILFLGVLLLAPGTMTIINSDTQNLIPIFSENKKNALYDEVQAFSEQYNIEPIDAKIDSVWKAIPGYNGLAVDIDASYKKMSKAGHFDKNKIIYKQIPPKVHLNDLAPEPIYTGNRQKPMVSLLINVAWGNEYIPNILGILNDAEVQATFFFDGSWVKKNPDLAKMIHLEGHEIGNHAYSHPDLKQRSREETIEELKKTNDVITATLGITPQWFAPPSGSFNMETIRVADELGMKTILWTVDTVDWKKPAAAEMVNRVVSQVDNGTMILMHPTKPVAEGLIDMIANIKEKGYTLGTVSDMMSEKRINDEN